MTQDYCGLLEKDDPLYSFLKEKVLADVLGIEVAEPVFDVYAMHPAMLVCRYYERTSRTDIACKFYGNKLPSDGQPRGADYFIPLLKREFENMQTAWNLGFDAAPFRVVRPLAMDPEINYVLAEEYITGPSLDSFFQAAIQRGDLATLYVKLEDLARFLGELHQRSQDDQHMVLVENGISYFSKIINQLAEKNIIDKATRQRLEQLRDRWQQSGKLSNVPQVLVHGDATPINFIFGDAHEVIAIDLERMHRADPMKDIGCVVAEVMHAFLMYSDQSSTAEPLIQHVYACYAEQRPEVKADWEALTERGRFWMGVTELRICRNDWLDKAYRQRLIKEAERCLQL